MINWLRKIWLSLPLALIPAQALAQKVPTIWSEAAFPVEHFQAYTSLFGWRWNHTNFHPGIDIAAPYGSLIHNWWVGRVVDVSADGGCGIHITVQSDRWQATYCHMEGMVVNSGTTKILLVPDSNVEIYQGELLPTGVIIGRVGMTGYTTGPHLHFQLEYNEQLIDPALVLQAMFQARIELRQLAKVAPH